MSSSSSSSSSNSSNHKKSQSGDFVVGDWFSRVSYCQIKEIHDDKFVLQNEQGHSWAISKNIVENECFAATQFTKTTKTSGMDLAHKLENAGDCIFGVTFRKKPNVSDVAQQLDGADLSSVAKRKKLAKEVLEGQSRTLIGYLISAEPQMGRCRVKDLEIPAGQHAERLVDTRTIESLIIKNVKYVKK